MASRVRKDFRLFTIDTEFLFPETYSLMDRIEEKYGITIEKVYSRALSRGAGAYARNCPMDARSRPCCDLRKVEPLRRKLGELSAWITSIRRDQTSVRFDRTTNRMGREIRPGEDQSNRRLELETGVALYPRSRRALQRTAQSGLSQHRLHALHARRAARRRSTRRTLARIRQDRMRSAHH